MRNWLRSGILFKSLIVLSFIVPILCFTSKHKSRVSINPPFLKTRTSRIQHSKIDTNFIGFEVGYKEIYSISDNLTSMKKLCSRLESCGVKKYYFVNDSNETEQLAPISDDGQIDLQPMKSSQLKKDKIIHVKTLVWNGKFLRNSTKSEDGNGMVPSEQGFEESFYFVTALRAEDKVDMKKLRSIVKENYLRIGGTVLLQLAEKEEAEKITGFASGSMPPGWHSIPLKLYVDDYIVEAYKNNGNYIVDESTNENGNDEECVDYSKVMLSVGSGMTNYSLHVTLLDLMMSSVYEENDMQLLQDLGLNSESKTISHERYIASFTRTRAEKMRKERQRQKMQASNRISAIDSVDDPDKPIKVTRRLFHVTAKKKGKVNEVKKMVKILGDDFPTFMQVAADVDDNRFASEFNKNALHYAAWKGDLETMTLLISESKRFEELGDVVNMISTGEGCYGKTPIFYAITQCRDDAVLHLLAHGATLLINNNKGQSPCSLAVNKLKPETCLLMFQAEEAELKAGRKFVDYRQSHSDGRRYGDIDPRFLTMGDINMDKDIQEELEEFKRFQSLESTEERKAMLDLKPMLSYSIPSTCMPRSVRITNPAARQAIRSLKQEDERLKRESLLPRSVRVTTPVWRQEAWLKKQEKKTKESRLHPSVATRLSLTGTEQKKEDVEEKLIPTSTIKLEDGSTIDLDKLEDLNLGDVLQCEKGQAGYELVDDDAGIMKLEFAIDQTLSVIEDANAQTMTDNEIISSSWGLDCEWRPTRTSGGHSPVATLQLSSSTRSFVVDTQKLLQDGVTDVNTKLTSTELILSNVLTKLLSSNKIRIIGFGIAQDLSKLAASFPHMPCFRAFYSVIDLYSLSRHAYPETPITFMSSLQKTVAILLRKRLDKTEQCSEWNERPLRKSQLEYASLDAAILPALLSEMLGDANLSTKKTRNVFIQKNAGLQVSYRFTLLEDDSSCSYHIPMGSIKTSYMNLKVARQMWPTLKKESPPLPTKMAKIEIRSPAKPKKVKKVKEQKTKKTAIELTLLSGDLNALPAPGLVLGYTKECCIERVIRNDIIEAIPENSYLRYNRRGGIVEIGNCWMLFVNFGVGRIHTKYRNEFRRAGRTVTFTVNPNRREDGELLQNLLISEDSDLYRKSVLFFMRGSSNEKFIYCGVVVHESHSVNEDNGLIDLTLELKQYEDLKMDVDGCTSTYMRIVSQNLPDDE